MTRLLHINLEKACDVKFGGLSFPVREYLRSSCDDHLQHLKVYNMSHEDPGNISYSEVGGLSEQIRELREVCSKCICVLKVIP